TAAFVLGLILSACSHGAAPNAAAQKRPPVPVLVARATRTTVPQQVSAIGTVQPYSTVEVKAQVGGEVVGGHFQEGQEVKKGQLRFTMDQRPLQAGLAQAKANLDKTAAQYKLALAEAKRWDVMYKVHAASSEQYDQAQSAAAALKANLEADQAAVQTA